MLLSQIVHTIGNFYLRLCRRVWLLKGFYKIINCFYDI